MDVVPDLLPPYIVMAGNIEKQISFDNTVDIVWHLCDLEVIAKDAGILWLRSQLFSNLDCIWELYLDVNNLKKGGNFRIKIYRKPPFTGSKTMECTVQVGCFIFPNRYSENGTTTTKTFDQTQVDLEIAVGLQGTVWWTDPRVNIKCHMKDVVADRAKAVPQLSSEIIGDGHGANSAGLARDLGRLLQTGEASDATINMGGVHFPVHRAILTARSDVFCAMFKHSTTERASGVVNIEDCETGTFRLFLQYLYTGRLENLSFEDAMQLYITADKYQVKDLMESCLECIMSNLSVETFCRTVTLMVKYGQRMELAIDFLRVNMQKIIPTEEWETFSCDHPKEANELLLGVLGFGKK